MHSDRAGQTFVTVMCTGPHRQVLAHTVIALLLMMNTENFYSPS